VNKNFQEDPLKKTLLVITLVVLGCSFALAQAPGTYSFWSASGATEYCNYNVITTNSGGVVAGYDDTTGGCFFANNSPIVGFSATTPALGLPAHGKGAVVGDAIYDDSCECYSGLQWTVWQSAKVSKKKHGFFTGAYGWVGVAGSFGGFYFGDNYGYLGAGYPEHGAVAGHPTTAGKAPSIKINK
jgi:hypothetical protein